MLSSVESVYGPRVAWTRGGTGSAGRCFKRHRPATSDQLTMQTATAYSNGATRIDHPQLGRVNAEYTYVEAEGNGEVYATLDLMRRYAVEDAGSPAIQQDAARVRVLAANGDEPLAHAVWRYVRGRMRFVRDEELVAAAGTGLTNNPDLPVIEVLVRPVDMSGGGVASRVGDCDDYSMWAASILEALGVRWAFVVMAGDARDASRFSHVYVAAYEDGRRIAIDASHGQYPGWESDNFLGLREERSGSVDAAGIGWLSVAVLAGAALLGVKWGQIKKHWRTN